MTMASGVPIFAGRFGLQAARYWLFSRDRWALGAGVLAKWRSGAGQIARGLAVARRGSGLATHASWVCYFRALKKG